VVGSLAVCLVMLEVAVRVLEPERLADGAIDTPWDTDGDSLFHVRSENLTLVYELRPSAKVYVKKFDRTFTTNAAGFRDHEFPATKRDGVYRIAAIGDSVTFGWGQALEDTFPKLLEARFADAGLAQVEVFNFGIGGYNSLQEVELIRTTALSFEPDLLLLAYVMNDNTVQGADGGLARHFNRTFCRACDFLELKMQQVYRRLWMSPSEEALSKLGALSVAAGIPVVVVVFPLMEQEGKAASAALKTRELIHSLAPKHGLLLLDLLEPFRSAGFENVARDAIHPNRTGNEIAAGLIFDFLRETQPAIRLSVPQDAALR